MKLQNWNRTLLIALGLGSLGLSPLACGGDAATDSGEGGEGNIPAEGCTVDDNGDGTATITCSDGSTAEITGVPGDTGAGCEAEDNGDGSWTITCGDSDPVVVEQASTIGTRVVHQNLTDLDLVTIDAGSGDLTRRRISRSSQGPVVSHQVTRDFAHVGYLATNDDGVTQLYLSNVEDDPTAPALVNGELIADGNVVSFQFSADGSHIGYIADEDTDGVNELYVGEIDGGDVSGIAKVNGDIDTGVTDFKFSENGEKVLFRAPGASTTGELYVAAANGEDEPLRVNADLVAATGVFTDYAFNGSANRVGYRAQQGAALATELYVAVLDGVDPDTADKVNDELDSGSVTQFAFSPNSELIAYVADEDDSITGNLDLLVADVSEENPGATTAVNDGVDNGQVTQFAFTASGSRLVFVGDLTTDGINEIYSSPVSDPEQVTLNEELPEDGAVASFQIVPETDNVVFLGNAADADHVELFFTPASGSGEPERVNPAFGATGSVVGFTIARDGSALSYHAVDSGLGVPAPYRVALGDDGPGAVAMVGIPSIVYGVPYLVGAPVISANGELVLYADMYLGLMITNEFADATSLGFYGTTASFLE